MQPISITLNGEARDIATGTGLSNLIQELNIDPRKVAIERNRAIVPRSEYAATSLMSGDEIEIVGFIGGG